MPMIYKVLGQVAPVATTAATLYTVPAAKSTLVSTLAICNRGVAGAYRIAIRPVGAVLANEHYIAYDAPIAANDSVLLTLGISLATTDVVTVYASSVNMSFSLFGTEIS